MDNMVGDTCWREGDVIAIHPHTRLFPLSGPLVPCYCEGVSSQINILSNRNGLDNVEFAQNRPIELLTQTDPIDALVRQTRQAFNLNLNYLSYE